MKQILSNLIYLYITVTKFMNIYITYYKMNLFMFLSVSYYIQEFKIC